MVDKIDAPRGMLFAISKYIALFKGVPTGQRDKQTDRQSSENVDFPRGV